LRAFKRLYRGLFIDGKHDGVVRRRILEADDVGRLRGKVRIVADALRLAAGKIGLLGSQETPDMLNMGVTERPRPAAVRSSWNGPQAAFGRAAPECAPCVGARIWLRAPLARVLEADHPNGLAVSL
jgi:hypothetical protein